MDFKDFSFGRRIPKREVSAHLTRNFEKDWLNLPNVVVTLVVPTYDEKEKQTALKHKVQHLATPDSELPGFDSITQLRFPPDDLAINAVIDYGTKLGPPANAVGKQKRCKRVHIVHTASEQISMLKNERNAIADGGRKHQTEVDLRKTADVVVDIGPKLTENIKFSLHYYGSRM